MGVVALSRLADRVVARRVTAPPVLESSGALRRSVPVWGAASLVYLGIAVLAIGRGALSGPAGTCACNGGSTDPSAYVWSLAWWPHALLAGLDPLYTHALWAPAGVSVAAAATVPAAAFALWPLTALFGPLVAYNVLVVVSPALAASTAFLLCRRLTGRFDASLLGGFLFGFSSFELAQLGGHANLALVFVLPVFVHLVLNRIDRRMSRTRFAVACAGAIVIQALLSTELLFDGLLVGAVALAIAAVNAGPPLRARIRSVFGEIVLAAAMASIVLAPYLIASFSQAPVPRSGDAYGLDALNLIVPTQTTWLGGQLLRSVSSTFQGGDYLEVGGYIGLPLLMAFTAFAVTSWRRIATRVLALSFLVSLLLALGPSLTIDGVAGTPMPWRALAGLPPFSDLVASRFIVFAWLSIAIATALWLAQQRRGAVRRWLLAVVGCAAVFPNLTSSFWASQPANPTFFTSAQYRHYLTPGQGLLTIPFAAYGQSMLWQAEAGFSFTMPGGYLSDVLPAAAQRKLPVALLLAYGGLSANVAPVRYAPILRRFLTDAGVRRIVIQPGYQQQWAPILRRIATPARPIGGILLYTLR